MRVFSSRWCSLGREHNQVEQTGDTAENADDACHEDVFLCVLGGQNGQGQGVGAQFEKVGDEFEHEDVSFL